MYPNLTPTLVALLAIALLATGYIAVRRPFLRRLALRQVRRRRTEAALVITGSILGSAVIVASLIVGDTLNYSVKQDAYNHLGPVDEVVDSANAALGADVVARLAPLHADPRVDGMMTVAAAAAAASTGTGQNGRAVPRTSVLEADLYKAATFGAAGSASGLTGPTPGAKEVVINSDLATALGVGRGSKITFYLYGQPDSFAVARVVPTRGLAGFGAAGTTGNDGTAFVAPGVLQEAARAVPGTSPHILTLVSNAGGVESGNKLSDQVTQRIKSLLGPQAESGITVGTPKHDVLKAAQDVGNGLGSLFLFIGSFSIIVGVVLLMNIYVMLAEERKPEMGMLRAIGMKRSRLVRSFVIEGGVYALLAAVLGLIAGIGVGRLAVVVAARVFESSGTGATLKIAFHVTPISLINAFALGFLIAIVTVAAMSMRISRFNIIAAIRDLPRGPARAHRRLTLVLCTAGAMLAALASVPVIANGRSAAVYALPALAAVLAIPALLRFAHPRAVYTGVSAAVLGWTAIANTVRPGVLETNSMMVYILMGCLLAVAAVVLVSQNQDLVLRPFRRIIEQPTPRGVSTRVAVTYPLARRFRTGAILVMYTLIVFTMVLLAVLSAMISSTVNQSIAAASGSGGYGLRADFNPDGPMPGIVDVQPATPLADKIAAVSPLFVAPARLQDLGPRRFGPADASVVGLAPALLDQGGFALSKRLPQFTSDRQAWQALTTNPSYVMLDAYVAAPSGPAADYYGPGDHLRLTDPSTGQVQSKTIAGIMKSSAAFTAITGRVAYPIFMGMAATTQEFGVNAKLASLLIRPAPGVSDAVLASQLQSQYLGSGMVVTRIAESVRSNYSSSMGFFQIMQGFLALGLLIAIAGLGVVMVRAVRERRRHIGVLRALGFRARWVQAAFLTESGLIATEGIVLGAGLSIFVSYLVFRNNSGFSGYEVGFTVPWVAVCLIVGLAWLGSLLATYFPARKAARIPPAVALRIAE